MWNCYQESLTTLKTSPAQPCLHWWWCCLWNICLVIVLHCHTDWMGEIGRTMMMMTLTTTFQAMQLDDDNMRVNIFWKFTIQSKFSGGYGGSSTSQHHHQQRWKKRRYRFGCTEVNRGGAKCRECWLQKPCLAIRKSKDIKYIGTCWDCSNRQSTEGEIHNIYCTSRIFLFDFLIDWLRAYN